MAVMASVQGGPDKKGKRKATRRQSKARTEEVYTTAARLFKENGYLNTPLTLIGKELNIQKASLYYYIKDKETLLFGILDSTMDAMIQQLSKSPKSKLKADKKLRNAVTAHIVHASNYLNEFSVLLHDTKHLRPDLRDIILKKRKQYEQIFLSIIEEGISEKIFANKDPKLYVYLILGSCNWIYQWFSNQGQNSPEEIADTFLHVFLKGLLKN